MGTSGSGTVIALTPFHHAELSPELAYLVGSPPDHDVVIRTLARKLLSQDQPLVQSDLVLAGRETLEAFPRTREYPVHFRKTYYPTSFHPPATLEFEKHEKIAPVLELPPPLGATAHCFRSCFIPGVSLDQLSPFGLEPLQRNREVAGNQETVALFGLWNLLERLDAQLAILHESGFVHGDLFLHNVIVSRSPVALCLIDFALAQERATEATGEEWEERCQADRAELERHALWVQCGLGGQPGALGEASRRRAPVLLGADAERCLRVIADHSLL